MVVCKYFLSGTCAFGENCRFEHPRGGGGGSGGGGSGKKVNFRDSFGTAQPQNQNFKNQSFQNQSFPNQSQYKWTSSVSGSQQQASTQNAISAEDIVKMIPREIEVWQASKMWPFSCLGLEKDIPSLPDIPDLSPEELRYDAYIALKQGNFQSYKIKEAQLAEEYTRKKEHLLSPTLAVRQNLVEFIEKCRSKRIASSSLIKPSLFGGQTGGSTFGSNAGTPSLFGSNTLNSLSSGFEQTQNLSGTLFPNTPVQPSNLFGSSQQGSGAAFSQHQSFGQNTSSGSIFGHASSANAAGGGSVFGQGQSGTGAVFGQSSSTPQTSFGQGISSTGTGSGGGVFSFNVNQVPSLQASTFGGNNTILSSNSQHVGQNNSFGHLFQNVSSTTGPGIGPSTSSMQPTPQNAGSSLYTPLDLLTAEERAQFEAKTFTPGRIPLRPPPRELISS